MAETPVDPAPGTGQIAQAISTAFVALLHDYTGQRPTSARTTIDHDTIVVTLRDSLTKAEHALAQQGQAPGVLAQRRAYSDAMREAMIAIVQRQTGRSVDAFLSDHLHDPDVAIKVFLLQPGDSDSEGEPDGC